MSAPPPPYAGLATRALALALDAAAINAIALAVGGVLALCTSLLHLPSEVERLTALAGAGAWVLLSAGWFVVFWSTSGQTPGDRVLRIRVRDAHEPLRPLKPRRALLRLGALVLGAIPCFAGYLPVLLDDRRRAFHDRVARTVVVHSRDRDGGGPGSPRVPHSASSAASPTAPSASRSATS
ncbi:RDD family protein [Conexibacter sp. JD483]|uniref:RDD family protein n=1 Tax=unclassified Conexibacter TaxID=2627773 RepID=UPI002725951E|nr:MULTISPECIES: RDD family protein [unclassified Conexibacter]MDO8185624.1 RDD family protein [Conexibacter sp. CPCC 205706]MDO8198797.1 RDD family protein [Conexibacter sp. CPCC 205762]MDR9367853.1 RDD family protein [Conexibacter sp. JD483]